jgi:uncharacterized protein YydD (DUF2326 family)
MKLSKIYANQKTFSPIVFNDGFNVIYGDVEKVINHSTGKVQEHNLGKTSLIDLIDFLLLKKVIKGNLFDEKQTQFSDWVFFLEIELNDGGYLTIRRPVNPNTKISFKKHNIKFQDFSSNNDWDYKDLSLSARENNPKRILDNEFLKFNVLPQPFDYRDFLPYLLRTQGSYNEVFELDNFYKHKNWKPLLFSLLGFDPNLLIKKYDLDDEIKDEEKMLKKLAEKADPEKVYTIKAAIEARQKEYVDLQRKIDAFDFYQKEDGLNTDLVERIESEISELNKSQYSLSYSIEQIRLSLESGTIPKSTINDIEEVFNDANIFFPKELAKTYKEVSEFFIQITKEREKYLKEELTELKEQDSKNRQRLLILNKQRSESLSVLKEKDTFTKFKRYQEDLLKIEAEILVYRNQLDGIKTSEGFRNSIEELGEKIKQIIPTIKNEIDKDNQDFKSIKDLFQNIYKITFEYTALLIVEPNQNGNIDFGTHVLSQSQDLTGKGKGHTSMMVLCASFVLAILIHYSSKSFFRFAYHDGILESWGDQHKINFIQLVRQYCKDSGIQYIISMIKSDRPINFNFEKEEIILTLSNSNKLFGFEF